MKAAGCQQHIKRALPALGSRVLVVSVNGIEIYFSFPFISVLLSAANIATELLFLSGISAENMKSLHK